MHITLIKHKLFPLIRKYQLRISALPQPIHGHTKQKIIQTYSSKFIAKVNLSDKCNQRWILLVNDKLNQAQHDTITL